MRSTVSAIAKKAGVYKDRKPSLSPQQVDAAKERLAAGVPKALNYINACEQGLPPVEYTTIPAFTLPEL
ncbi:MAG: hypothetical protein JWQ42_1704 [Edaphobacter sp.]|nr:hypothetical protein [Edaphobacter sp.]